MAKKEERSTEKIPTISEVTKKSEHHEQFLPKGRLLWAIFLIFIGLSDYLQFNFVIPKLALNIVLILTGLYLVLNSFSSASARRRRALMKKYI